MRHRRNRRIAICLLLSCAVPTCSVGATSARPPALTATLSYGSDSCGQFVEASPGEKPMYVAWVVGYISGENVWDHGKGRLAGLGWDQASVTVWLTNYCTKNPLTLFANAARALRKEWGGNDPK